MTLREASAFWHKNFRDLSDSPRTLLNDENTISAIHLFPLSLSFFHPSRPSFFVRTVSSLLRGDPLARVLAFFLILIAGSISSSSRMLKFFLASYALSPYTFAIFPFFDVSFTRGTNFFESPVRSDVTRNPLILPVFLSVSQNMQFDKPSLFLPPLVLDVRSLGCSRETS